MGRVGRFCVPILQESVLSFHSIADIIKQETRIYVKLEKDFAAVRLTANWDSNVKASQTAEVWEQFLGANPGLPVY
jgi:hypothetical protein